MYGGGGLLNGVSESTLGVYSVVSEGDVRCMGGCIVWSVREM